MRKGMIIAVALLLMLGLLALSCGRSSNPTAPEPGSDKVILEPPDSTCGGAQPEIPKYWLIDEELDTTRGW